MPLSDEAGAWWLRHGPAARWRHRLSALLFDPDPHELAANGRAEAAIDFRLHIVGGCQLEQASAKALGWLSAEHARPGGAQGGHVERWNLSEALFESLGRLLTPSRSRWRGFRGQRGYEKTCPKAPIGFLEIAWPVRFAGVVAALFPSLAKGWRRRALSMSRQTRKWGRSIRKGKGRRRSWSPATSPLGITTQRQCSGRSMNSSRIGIWSATLAFQI